MPSFHGSGTGPKTSPPARTISSRKCGGRGRPGGRVPHHGPSSAILTSKPKLIISSLQGRSQRTYPRRGYAEPPQPSVRGFTPLLIFIVGLTGITSLLDSRLRPAAIVGSRCPPNQPLPKGGRACRYPVQLTILRRSARAWTSFGVSGSGFAKSPSERARIPRAASCPQSAGYPSKSGTRAVSGRPGDAGAAEPRHRTSRFRLELWHADRMVFRQKIREGSRGAVAAD